MIKEQLKLLVIEGYTRSGREELAAGGMSVASDLYNDMLLSLAPNAKIDIITPADPDASLPTGVELKSYDGAAMTGSSLSVLDTGNPAVRSQIELQREIFNQGVPSYGSCWALQVGAVVAGGKVAKNPKGREMGFARKIHLTDDGVNHPFYRGKGPVFDGFASHEDEIVTIPPGSRILSGNSFSKVQAIEISFGQGIMWTVQYHPEYTTRELAALIRCREERLIRMGFFSDSSELNEYSDRLDLIHEDPSRKNVAWSLGIDMDILDPKARQREVRNWLESLVLPEAHR